MSGAGPNGAPPRNLVVLGTGGLGVSMLPFWLTWLSMEHPDVRVRCYVTDAATAYVSRRALSVLSGNPARLDRFDDDPESTVVDHLEILDRADGIAVAPASANTIVRLAQGLSDTPVSLAIAMNTVPVCVAPSLPSGAGRAPTISGALGALAGRRGVVVLPTQAGREAHTARMESGAMVPFSRVLDGLVRARADLATAGESAKAA